MQTNCTGNIRSNYLDCSQQNLLNIPSFSSSINFNFVGANFRNNKIKEIVAYSFENISQHLQDLDLSSNQISRLDVKSFSGLFRLKSLRLGHNRLCLPSAYPDGIFDDLRGLQVLFTLGNICDGGHRSYPDQSFKDLVSLKKLSLDVAANFTFGSGFQRLSNLSSVETTGYGPELMLIAISNHSFFNLQDAPILELIIRGSAYGSIESGALKHFKVLQTLNVACAEHLFASIMTAIYKMSTVSLETVIFDGVPLSYNNIFCHPNLDSVQKLSIRQTGLTKNNAQREFKNCLPNLKHLNIGINGIHPFDFYPRNMVGSDRLLQNGVSANSFWMNHPLKILDASLGSTQSFFIKETYCQLREQDLHKYFQNDSSALSFPETSNDTTVRYQIPEETRASLRPTGATIQLCTVSPFIKSIYLNDLSVGSLISLTVILKCPWILYPFDSLVYFNMSGNEVGQLSCPVLGMKTLKVFDCSRCKLNKISPEYAKQENPSKS